MTEFEKMRCGELFDCTDRELLVKCDRARTLCARLQTMTVTSEEYRRTLAELIPRMPESSYVMPPFHCDYGDGIQLGEQVFINYNCTFLDGGLVQIGSRTWIGPNCQLLTPNHPLDYRARQRMELRCEPIRIGEDCWLGAGVIVCPGVHIGNHCVVGAGSVVTKDLPADSVAVGNPAKVVKQIL